MFDVMWLIPLDKLWLREEEGEQKERGNEWRKTANGSPDYEYSSLRFVTFQSTNVIITRNFYGIELIGDASGWGRLATFYNNRRRNAAEEVAMIPCNVLCVRNKLLQLMKTDSIGDGQPSTTNSSLYETSDMATLILADGVPCLRSSAL